MFIRLIKVLAISTILVMAYQAQYVGAEEINDVSEVDAQYEMFVDFLGDVNFTYYADGSQYEGLSLNTEIVSYTETANIKFALSIGAFHVVYYKNADGSVPNTIEELYADDIQTFVLYDGWATETSTESIESGIDLSTTPEYDGGADNLTIDTLAVDSTEELFSFSEMIENTTESFIDTTIVSDAAETKYSAYAADIIDWDKDTELIDEFDEDLEPTIETYGTENMTRTVYIWLARLVEAEKGYSINTVDIDDNTETISSEAVTVQYDEDAYNDIRETIDEELIAAGVEETDLAGLPSLSGIGRSISKSVSRTKGSFSFSRGLSVSNLRTKAAVVKDYARSVGASGARVVKGVVKSAVATTRTAGMAATSFVQKASSKTTGFFSNAGKVVKSKFAFLGGIVEKVKKTVSFLLKYWWLWLMLFVVIFILFATPVGPFLMNSTIRKIVKK